jgi:hypothetical protein
MNFVPMPKIPRLSREIVITEKIDGTNASVYIPPPEEAHLFARKILAGSRTRRIEPGDDNFGFAGWVEKNWEELVKLGAGHHFGEWWGKGIQRGYGLEERRFSLFNVGRWHPNDLKKLSPAMPLLGSKLEWAPDCCHVVPVLYRGDFTTGDVQRAIGELKTHGSRAAPGFVDPEGVMVYHTAANMVFKKTIKGDEEGKHTEAHPKKKKPPRPPKDPTTGGRRKMLVEIAFPDRRIG